MDEVDRVMDEVDRVHVPVYLYPCTRVPVPVPVYVPVYTGRCTSWLARSWLPLLCSTAFMHLLAVRPVWHGHGYTSGHATPTFTELTHILVFCQFGSLLTPRESLRVIH